MNRARGVRLLRRTLAVLGWSALALQFYLSARLAVSEGCGVGNAALMYFGYFTILTNLFVAALCSRREEPSSALMGCAVTSIVLVGIVYHLLLRHLWNPQGAQWLADVVLHYVVPAGTLSYWSLRAHPLRLAAWWPLAWSAYPVAYLAYALVRGEWLGVYPYPFIDVAAIGYPRVMLNAIGLLAVFATLGFATWAMSRRGAAWPEPAAQRG
jgi:hypothetical protein